MSLAAMTDYSLPQTVGMAGPIVSFGINTAPYLYLPFVHQYSEATPHPEAAPACVRSSAIRQPARHVADSVRESTRQGGQTGQIEDGANGGEGVLHHLLRVQSNAPGGGLHIPAEHGAQDARGKPTHHRDVIMHRIR